MDLDTSAIPLGLYIHFPWCVKKCPYCDFNSHSISSDDQERLPLDLQQQYIQCLINDFQQEQSNSGGRELTTIFLGGGTPSLFSPVLLKQLLTHIKSHSAVSAQAEITMETNPGTAEHWDFGDYLLAGINRLSFGAQSFDNHLLAQLGRIHQADHIYQAVNLARQAGFDNINLDLMYGLPGQDAEQMRKDLKTAISLSPQHLSWYQLTLEPNTVFYRHPPALPADDAVADMSQQGIQLLAESGYQRYEISAFNRDNWCQHNLNYWTFGDYLGIGAGAHGKVSSSLQILRRWKTRLPKDYMHHYSTPGTAHGRQHQIDKDELPLEFLMNALRLMSGVPTALFEERTGQPLSRLDDFLESGKKANLLDSVSNRIKPTTRGSLFLDTLLGMI